MACRKLSLSVVVIGLALTTTAYAADMPGPIRSGPQVQEYFSAWYLRLDGGYRFNSMSQGQLFGTDFDTWSLKNSATVGGGVGYKWGWFRADVTADYGSQPQFIGNAGAILQHVTANISNYTVLGNVYADLGTWWGVTPYVGAGAGVSQLRPGHITLLFPELASTPDTNRLAFSWAAMAGLTYQITPVFLIDASYRYLDIGDARNKTLSGGLVKYGDMTAQEVRVGLRYLIP